MAKAPGGADGKSAGRVAKRAGRGWAAKRAGLDGQLGGLGGKSAAWGWAAKRAGRDGQQGGMGGKSAGRVANVRAGRMEKAPGGADRNMQTGLHLPVVCDIMNL